MPLSSRMAAASAMLWLGLGGAVAHAQQPCLERMPDRLPKSCPESQLMGYYAAVMHFSPTGLLERGAGLEVGAEISYLPNLSAEDQQVGFNGRKAENTNFCPVFPRLRVSGGFGPWAVDLGYLPPLRVCDVEPHMISGAVTRRFEAGSDWSLALRASTHFGRLEAPITCNEAAVQDPTNNECFEGQVSNDRFRPFSLGLDGAVAYTGLASRRVEPYLLIGVRREDLQFRVNFVYSTGSLDTARLGATLTRLHVAAGSSWRPTSRIRLGGELFYAPRALLTVRTRASYVLQGRP